MNLQVNLILQSEQRSGSVLSLKSLLRIVGIILPVVVLLALGSSLLNLMILRGELKLLESRWADVEPKKEQAVKLAEQLVANKSILAELNGWNTSHIDWYSQFSAIRDLVPATIQLQSLRVSQTLQLAKKNERDEQEEQPAGPPARAFELMLSGRATGTQAERDIQYLKRGMERSKILSSVMKSCVVSRYGEDTNKGASEYDRVFQIDCVYTLRKFE